MNLASEIKMLASLGKVSCDPEGVAEIGVRERAHLRAFGKLDSQIGPDQHFLRVDVSEIPGTVDCGSRGSITRDSPVQSEEPNRAWGLFCHG
jgi:hypothetical protein